jgi:hypothetical protein
MNSSIPLLVAAASSVISFCALLVTSLQLLTTRRNARRQMRAYVGICLHKISNVTEGKKPLIQLTIKNFGQTPARNVRYWLNTKFEEYPLNNVLPEQAFRSESVVLFPDDPNTFTFELAAPLNAVDMVGIESGSRRLFIYGHIRYTDAFKRDRNTRFRLMYGGVSNLIPGQLVWAEAGNDQD